jgi:hypothetical protein
LIPSILFTIFQTPSSCLPENMGSVLLLLGQQTSYLQHIIMQVTTREDVCTNFENISTHVIGLAIMTARFRWSFVPVPGVQREDFFRAIWKALAEEVTDIR